MSEKKTQRNCYLDFDNKNNKLPRACHLAIFGVCTIPVVQTFRTSNDCLFTITVVSYPCFILRDPYSNYKVGRDHEDKNVGHGRKVVKKKRLKCSRLYCI